ncbi:MAG: hypothetical protein WD049_01235 [Candidatus Paceibacterota bacterium]
MAKEFAFARAREEAPSERIFDVGAEGIYDVESDGLFNVAGPIAGGTIFEC